jgi:hypothetical protein
MSCIWQFQWFLGNTFISNIDIQWIPPIFFNRITRIELVIPQGGFQKISLYLNGQNETEKVEKEFLEECWMFTKLIQSVALNESTIMNSPYFQCLQDTWKYRLSRIQWMDEKPCESRKISCHCIIRELEYSKL